MRRTYARACRGPLRRLFAAAEKIGAIAIEALDVFYVPSRNVEANGRFYPDVLGGRVIFAIAAMGTRVAEVAIGLRRTR